VAYRTSLSEGTEVFHGNLRERWRRNDPEVLEAMMLWASYAEQGRDCLLNGDYSRLNELVDANFDLRASLFRIDPGNLDMVGAARKAGASANFAGSGGAIVGTYTDEDMFQRLAGNLKPLGVVAIRPKIAL
jgi:glucuronokinase